MIWMFQFRTAGQVELKNNFIWLLQACLDFPLQKEIKLWRDKKNCVGFFFVAQENGVVFSPLQLWVVVKNGSPAGCFISDAFGGCLLCARHMLWATLVDELRLWPAEEIQLCFVLGFFLKKIRTRGSVFIPVWCEVGQSWLLFMLGLFSRNSLVVYAKERPLKWEKGFLFFLLFSEVKIQNKEKRRRNKGTIYHLTLIVNFLKKSV